MPTTINPAASPGGSNTSVPSLKRKPLVVEYDADGFHTLKSIPIFDSHHGREEGLDVDFDEDKLKQICMQCNARIRDTGDQVPVTDRHSSDSGPEPEILGYASNFTMGRIGKVKPRACIMADLRIHKTKMAKVKTLPRRSIELWPDMAIDPVVLQQAKKPAIDSVALLGGERPARDLGLLFSKNSVDRAIYRYEFAKENMNPEEIVKQCIEALHNLPEFAFLRDLMAKQQAPAAEEEAAMGAEEDGMEDEAMMQKKCMSTDDPAAKDDEMNLNPATKDDEALKLNPAKLRMQFDQSLRRYARLEAEHKALGAKVATLEKKERLSTRKADLMQLEAEGYSFDMADEIEYVMDLEPVRYSKHLNKIKKNYAKAPVGVNIPIGRVNAEGGVEAPVSTPDDVYKKVAGLYKYGRTLDHKPTTEEN